MAENLTISEQMAEFALSLMYEQIPLNVIDYGKMLLMDTFGVAMSCQKLPHAEAVKNALLELKSPAVCTLWGGRDKASLADVALYNSSLIHGADYDDTHVAAIVHPSAAVTSTAVTVGEHVNASGRDMMTAIVAGWEIIVRLGLAAKGRFHDVGYHGTGIVAPFAAACVAAKLMGFSKETLVNALGICGSQSAALQEFLNDGSWTKKIHPGWGAHSAIYALLMARHGYVGPKRVFEGKFGMWKTHVGDIDGLQEEFRDIGKVWHTPEIAFKMYPVCHMTHSFIDCMLALQKEYGFTADDIQSAECRIENRCYKIVCDPREAKIHPQSDYMMRFSLPYVVAIAAIKGAVGPWEVNMKYAKDPAVLDLMSRIQCVPDESKRNPGRVPGWLKVVTKDGHEYVKDQRYELGTLQNPIKIENVIAKFNSNLIPFYTKNEIQVLVNKIKDFDKLSNAEELIQCFVSSQSE